MADLASSAAARASPPQHSVQDLLIVDGMFCGGCASSLERRLAKLPGMQDVAVDLASGAALLQWLPGREDVHAAFQLVSALGYSARRPNAPPASEGARDPARSLQLSLVISLFFGMWTMLPSIALYLDAAPDATVANRLAWFAAVASLPVIAYAGRPFYAMALSTLRAGVAGIDALVSVGVLGALALSTVSLAQGGSEVYFEVAVALITLQLLARLIQLNVARAGRDALARLLDLAPPRVMRLDTNGQGQVVAVGDVVAGDVLVAEAGDTLAVDGVVEAGGARLDRRLLTGESAPVRAVPGEPVTAGEVVVEGPLRLRVTAPAGERRIDNLARQVRALLVRKPDWQRGVDVVARYFLVLAVLAAAVGALLAASAGEDAIRIAERALAVFVIACPCALSLAAPLAGLAATRRAVEAGVLLRDLRVLPRAGQIDMVFLDKTGTLTEGRPVVQSLYPVAGVRARELLAVAAFIERHSRHPFATAIVKAAVQSDVDLNAPEIFGVETDGNEQRRTLIGRGVRLTAAEMTLRIGSAEWLAEEGLCCPPLDEHALSRVWVAKGNQILGAIDLDDPLRAGAAEAIAALRQSGINVIMLSGDAEAPVARVAERLGIEAIARCSPEDKVARVEAAAAKGCGTAFVGDGLNDGPAIAAADLGVAVEGALDAARTASAVTLLRGGVERLPEVLALVTSAGRVLRQNISFAVGYNALAVPAAIVGWVHPAVAAIAMAASSITIVINSLRVQRVTEVPVDQPVSSLLQPIAGRYAHSTD